MTEPSANVAALLADAAARAPNRIALATRETSVTFAELWRRVNATAAGLERTGVRPGDRMLCFVPMSLDLYVALLALLKMGAVAVFVDPWIGLRQMAAFAAAAEPRGFIGVAQSHWLRLFEPVLRALPVTVTTGRRIGPWPARWTLRELEVAGSVTEIHPVTADTAALITFTSGSSGTPKGANRTHGFLAAQHVALQAEFTYRDDDVDLTMFPVFALNNLARGITSVIPAMDFRHVAAVDAGVVAAQMRQWHVTTCTASPPLVDRLAAHRPPLRRLLTGGAPITDDQLKHWQQAWPDTEIVVVYGSTEAEPVAHISAAERLAARNSFHTVVPGFCMGRPVTPARVIPLARGLVTWSANELPAGAIGELIVTGAHVCQDYFRNPQAVAENKILAPDGAVWHRMGDTGYFDEQGRFWLTGRLHSTIWRAGEPVQAQLLEQAAGVTGIAAVGVTDPQLGERVVLVMTGAADQESIRQHVAEAGLAVDEIVVSGRALPLDPRHNAKVDYGKLKQWLEHKPRS
jgi:acyl-CoA synthetase (AMP-forming)/AMP-acid ligase II